MGFFAPGPAAVRLRVRAARPALTNIEKPQRLRGNAYLAQRKFGKEPLDNSGQICYNTPCVPKTAGGFRP